MKNTQAIDLLKSSRGRRLVRLMVAAACFVTLTWLAFNTSFQSHQLLYKQADMNARSLARQLALNAAQPLIKEDVPLLKQLSQHLESDKNVLSIAIYNNTGELIVASEGFTQHDNTYGLPQQLPGISKLKTSVVEPITANDRPLGFVSMVYLTQSAMSQSHYHFHELGRMVLLMLLITGVFTWQIGRALKGWEVKRQIRKSVQDDK
ncbi:MULTISPECIES: AhpA/YtjB family protein [Pseudoalteromonas]|uniref:Smp protein n=1 Tax=Pseudoalteromonas amylolytica TaxID=1859457 RepID=A0A1S1MWV4_9GAMM|nr:MULTISPECIES: AhpA/YtjB family protein [Pseudoalteromonas]OHU88517.1 smp protein [Pseudoalteromonas sp. JW3]OHU90360.1 smp protein [Pseudoalteromonas amylolytica]